MRRDLAADPLVASWVDKGWPLVRRRAVSGEGRGVALGLPLPPSVGKRRLSFLIPLESIVSTAPPPALTSARRAAPRAWQPTLDRLDALASRHSLDPRVFGSLAWRALTGLDYLSDRSDLDLLLHVRRDTDLRSLAADIAMIEAAAPIRLDAELVREDGAAANWRELHVGAREILVKTLGGVALVEADGFLLEATPS
jgi:phosphoribosyl-dephospho-CoA transferase